MAFRYGHIEVSSEDFHRIAVAMNVDLSELDDVQHDIDGDEVALQILQNPVNGSITNFDSEKPLESDIIYLPKK